MDIEQVQLEKARIFAYWGYIGLMFPIAGIISAAVSISILDRLVINEDDEDALGEHARIKSTANIARILSIILLIATIIGAIIATVQVVEAQKSNPVTEYYQRVLDNVDSE